MPRIPRMTTRRWMIVVAVVGVILTAARLVYLWRHYQALAAMHASEEVAYIRQARDTSANRTGAPSKPPPPISSPHPSGAVRGNGWRLQAVPSHMTCGSSLPTSLD